MRTILILMWAFSITSHGDISLEFLNDVEFDSSYKVKGQLFGGISGITKLNEEAYIGISDDRGERGVPRFFHIKMREEKGTISINPYSWVELKAKTGSSYKVGSIDFEGVSILENGNIAVSTEGDSRPAPRINPEIMEYTKSGKYVKNWNVPSHFFNEDKGDIKKGVRFNYGFESLDFLSSSRTLYTMNEVPLFQDGKFHVERPSLVRLLKYKDLEGYEEVDDEGEPTGIKVPYVVTLSEDNGQVLSIRRNFQEDDELKMIT